MFQLGEAADHRGKTAAMTAVGGVSAKKVLLAAAGFAALLLLLYMNRAMQPGMKGGNYPLQELYHKYTTETETYDFIIVADMDQSSKMDGQQKWKSELVHGRLIRNPHLGTYSVAMQEDVRTLVSSYNDGARGMELSDICNFNGKVYTFDDRTGLVYEIGESHFSPAFVLADGDGTDGKGFKAEWCTVKNDELYIGGMGKEWTDQKGNFVNYNPMYVKTISASGELKHVRWVDEYNAVRKATGTLSPGYILNEAVVWLPNTGDDGKGRWLITPRRLSKEKYDAELDEYRCTNKGMLATEDFSSVTVLDDIGGLIRTRGFSSIKFLPFRENEVVVLKTEEVSGANTYMMVYNLNTGEILMPDTHVGNNKFEGLEFV